jgi:hypothetical protein
MKPVHREILIFVVCLSLGFLFSRLTLHYFPAPKEVRIDCSIAEISPDFTPEMKEACRKLNRQ